MNQTFNMPETLRKSITALALSALVVGSIAAALVTTTTRVSAADTQTCSTITLVSGPTTQSAGFTEVNPTANPLAVGSYSHAYSSATNTATSIPPWVDPATNSTFATSGAKWIGSASTSPGTMGNGEGSSTNDQWRLFQGSFTLPAGAVVSSADVWYTADNAVALYQNGAFLARTGGATDDVFGVAPSSMPANFGNVFHTSLTPASGATTTLNFVTRNWSANVASNPTGLLYKVVVNYCVANPVSGNINLITNVNNTAGGTSTPGSFTVHLLKNGVEVAGSPQMGSSTGTLYSGLASSTYTVTETGLPSGYTAVFSGNCTSGGVLTLNSSTTLNCTITNTYASSSPATSTPATGNLMIVKTVSGGTASSSAFMMHVKKNGNEIVGSPTSGSSLGTTYNNIATSTYVVSETGGPMGYMPTFSGACDANGNVTVVGSSTVTCNVLNTFTATTSTTTPPTGNGTLNVIKFVGGGIASAADFMIHLMSNGNEVSGSPKVGSMSGSMFSGLGTSSTGYILSETGPSGYVPYYFGDCSMSGGVTMATTSAKTCYLVNIFSPNSTSTEEDYGSISGTVYNDRNRNGVRNWNEPGLEGFTIKLYDHAGWSGPSNSAPYLTTVSDEDGNYSFSNLPAGTYSIEEVNRPKWHQDTGDFSPVVLSHDETITDKNFGNTSKKRGDHDKGKNHLIINLRY